MSAPTWTPDQIAQLKALVSAGVTYREIGQRMGISKNAAISKANRLQLAHRRSQKPAKERRGPDFPSLGRCVWPNGHPGTEDFAFCGASVVRVAVPYCPTHMRQAYQRSGSA